MNTTPAHAALLLLAASLATLLPASAAEAATSCHGVPATIEGTSGVALGTPGDDVIVVGGTVSAVDAGAGDDLICVVDTVGLGQGTIRIDAGAGDDVVDASQAGARTAAYLPSGADSFTGSDFGDTVLVGIDVTTFRPTLDPGPYLVATGLGDDDLQMSPGATVNALLGRGDDQLTFRPLGSDTPVAAGPDSSFDLGKGRDQVTFDDRWESPGGGYRTTLVVDMPRQRLRWWGVESTILRAEDVWAGARRAVVRGTSRANMFFVNGCHVLLAGRGGDDRLSSRSYAIEDGPTCEGIASRHRILGGGGDDRLAGTHGHDVLIGGPGYDTADGGRGDDDRCDVEKSWGKGCR